MTTPKAIDNTEDLIDVRDVIARVEHLEELEQSGPVDLGAEDNDTAQDDLFQELATLRKLLDELKGRNEQWRGYWYPVILVRDSYFEHFAQQEAEDLGLIPEDIKWPCTHIDWERAARELQMYHSQVEFDGVTYWYR